MPPAIVLHADWSTDPKKRWVAQATLDGNVYRLSEPRPADTHTLISSALSQAGGGNVLVGFDFPIGLPRAFARTAGIRRFLEALPEFGKGRWQRFYEPAALQDEISVERPFYPARPGGKKQEHLVSGLGVGTMNDLLRRCDRGNENRNKACAIFWTLGGNQVGRAAIAGWREVLVPAIRSLGPRVGVWPFDGELSSLLETRACVIAETYPADACVQIGLRAPGRGWSKRKQEHRVTQATGLQGWARSRPVDLEGVNDLLSRGFGADRVGEDRFDAFVGLCGMLDVVLGRRGAGVPQQDEDVQTVEGWILGQRP